MNCLRAPLALCRPPTVAMLSAACLLAMLNGPATAVAQSGRDSVPSTAYFSTLPAYYDGEYRDALGSFQSEGRSAIKTAESRWIDSICYHAMTGECHYQTGRLAEALEQYNSALKLYVAYHNWMLRVQFPATISMSGAGRPAVPWGRSTRTSTIGRFPETFMMSRGQIDNSQVVKQGGVVQTPALFPVHVSEIVRCTTLALRRRHELMGPVCQHDRMTRELVEVLSRRAAPSNNWSEGWIEVQLGIALAAAGNSEQAASVLQHALIVGGEFDHPLTSVALLELGRLAMEAGDFDSAAKLFAETTFAAVTFPDMGVLEEAFRYGSMTHLISNQKGMYPPLAPAIGWAKTRSRQLYASLLVMAAENLAVLGETPKANSMLSDARGVMTRSDMLAASVGARLNHFTALAAYQAGNVKNGDAAMAAALKYQQTGSLWMFHITQADSRYMSGDKDISNRVAMMLYQTVLRDPAPADWATSPLECLSVLTLPHPAPFEHWFEMAWKNNNNHDLALEISDRIRRHRFFSTLPMGGRLLALRWILEGPEELLNEQAQLQRQDLLARYPRYEQLAQQARELRTALAAKPLVEEAQDARRAQTKQLATLGDIAQSQELILREIAVRRDPAEMVFPPLRRTRAVQKVLPAGHVLLSLLYTSGRGGSLHAFMYSKDKYAQWQVVSPSGVQKQLVTLLRDLGNFEQNHQLGQPDLAKAAWRKSAAKMLEMLFDKSSVDLSLKFDELTIVPDGPLWYLPFEALPVSKAEDAPVLISKVRIRYAPTVGLAVPYARTQKPQPNTAVMVGKLYPKDTDTIARDAFDKMARAIPAAVALPSALPAPSAVYRTLFDQLVVLDDIKNDGGPYDWPVGQTDRHKAGGTLGDWMALPWGGPVEIVLPGYHSAAENALKKSASGTDLFLSICGLMSTGARTILITRWRAGGQSSFDLVREFTQELPHTSPADAWQRSVELVSDRPLDPELEPRLKKAAAGAEPPRADHPFFWSAFLLVDTGRLTESDEVIPPAPALDFQKKQNPANAAAKPGDKVGKKKAQGADEADEMADDDPPAEDEPAKRADKAPADDMKDAAEEEQDEAPDPPAKKKPGKAKPAAKERPKAMPRKKS